MGSIVVEVLVPTTVTVSPPLAPFVAAVNVSAARWGIVAADARLGAPLPTRLTRPEMTAPLPVPEPPLGPVVDIDEPQAVSATPASPAIAIN